LNARRYYTAARIYLVTIWTFTYFILSLLIDGDPLARYMLITTAGVAIICSPKEQIKLIIGYIVLIGASFAAADFLGDFVKPVYVPTSKQLVSIRSNIEYSLFAIVVVLLLFERWNTERVENLLIQERERADNLLLNVLPAPIANQFKKKPEVIADGFTDTSILFADIVGFTKLA